MSASCSCKPIAMCFDKQVQTLLELFIWKFFKKVENSVSKFLSVQIRVFVGDTHRFKQKNHVTMEALPNIHFQQTKSG